jgi:hypothetical protein
VQPYEPFTGVIVLPDRAPFGTTSPVTLGDGQPVASIRWHNWSMRARFEILDAYGATTLASGSSANAWGRRYRVLGQHSEILLELKLGMWGPTGKSRLLVPDGRILTTVGTWTSRKFSIVDQHGMTVARLVTTSPILSSRPDSLALELAAPVLSIVQAIGFAQCMRAAVAAARSASG